jgi:hypothetical protein
VSLRFSIVSLTAIFSALAIGLVLGTAALNGPASDPLRDQIGALDQQNRQLKTQVGQLDQDVKAGQDLTQQLAPAVLEHRLSGARVLLLSTASGAPYVDSVARMLSLAGANVTGRLRLTNAFTDPSRVDDLLDLAHAALPPSVVGGLPVDADGIHASAALLAAVLLNRAPPVTEGDRRSVLTAYTSRGFIATERGVTDVADAIVLVSGGQGDGTAGLIATADQLHRAGTLVLAADAAGKAIVTGVRGNPLLAASISTVDNLGKATPGSLVTAWALAEQFAGRVGHYGTGAGASLLPKISA